MIEKVKLGIWDYFVYLMTGATVLLIVVMHCVLKGVVSLEQILETPAVALVALLLIALLLLGMLVEPIANLLYKLVENKPKKWRNELGLKKWDEQIKSMESEAQKYVPEAIQGTPFPFAKNWVLNNGDYSEFQAFLSKYGFYRSISFVFALNAIATVVIHWVLWGLVGLILNVVLASLFCYRAAVFYRHMSVSIYNQFIQGHCSEKDDK